MVDEKVPPDRGAGMDVDARLPVGVFRHDPGQHGYIQFVEFVGQAEDHDGVHTGIAIDDLVRAEGRRIAVELGLYGGIDEIPDFRDARQEFQGQLLPAGLARAKILILVFRQEADEPRNLLAEIEQDIFHQGLQIVFHGVVPVGFDAEIPGKEDFLQLVQNVDDHLHVRPGKARALVDGASLAVVFEDGIGDFFDSFFQIRHRYSPLAVISYYSRYGRGWVNGLYKIPRFLSSFPRRQAVRCKAGQICYNGLDRSGWLAPSGGKVRTQGRQYYFAREKGVHHVRKAGIKGRRRRNLPCH